MLVYRKNQTKSDPVREILARIEERQSKTGLSLFVKEANIGEEKLPSVRGEGKISGSVKSISPSKTTSMFPNVTAAREKAQARFHAVEVETEFKSSMQRGKSHKFQNKRITQRLNKTFPPVLPHYNRTAAGDILAPVSGTRNSYGGSDLISGLGINMNPFGYSRRNLAYSRTHTNYVVEWPETWPLKILSLDKERKKAVRTKLNPQPPMKRDKQDLVGDKKCETMPQSLPSKRKAEKVSMTKAERNIRNQPHKDLTLEPKRQSTVVNYSGNPPKQRTVLAASNRYSPPIPPYPSSEQMERSPLGDGKAILPPIINKDERDNVCKDPQGLLFRETCGITLQEDKALRNEERCVNIESSATRDITAMEGTVVLSQEKEEGKNVTLLASEELDTQVRTQGVMNDESRTVAPHHPNTPLHNKSGSSSTDDKPFFHDSNAAVISRVESKVAPRYPTTLPHNDASSDDNPFILDNSEAAIGRADSQVALRHPTTPLQSGTASNGDKPFTFDNSKAVIWRIASQVAEEDMLTDSQNI